MAPYKECTKLNHTIGSITLLHDRFIVIIYKHTQLFITLFYLTPTSS
jgi:hypothetical protein